VNDLAGRERLIQVQNQLVDLLHYIESEEGLATQKLKKIKLVGNQVVVDETPPKHKDLEQLLNWLPLPNLVAWLPHNPSGAEVTASSPQIVHKTKGRIRLRLL